MLINAKINVKNYCLYSLVLLILAPTVLRSINEFGVVLLVFLATCVNHWLLITTVRKMSLGAVTQTNGNRRLISIMTIGKLILVTAALSFGVQIMGKRIIIPLLIYVLQIVVLYLSFEKKTSAEKGT